MSLRQSTEAMAAFEAWYRERFPDADFSDALWDVEWRIWWAAWQAAKAAMAADSASAKPTANYCPAHPKGHDFADGADCIDCGWPSR
jgi:hypothetical protein